MHGSGEQELENALIKRILAVLKQRMPFEDAVREYRQIEAEFVARAGDDAVRVADTKRSINNHLLMEAEIAEQPYEVCREIWEELVRLEFWNMEMRHVKSSTYARCCQWNGEFDAGLAVLEPLIAELEVLLAQPSLTPNHRAFCAQFLGFHKKQRDDLKVGIRERLMPMSRKLEAEEIALTQRMNAVRFRERKDDLSFEDAVREYREIEAEFVQRAGDDASQVLETKRRITESILRSAYETEQPHDVCRTIWEELVQRGFSNLERRHSMGDTYVECCQFNGEFDAALAVVEPFLAELQHQVDTGTDEDMPSESYPEEIARLTKLRDELLALKKQ